MEELAEEYSSKVKFVMMNLDDSSGTAESLGIMGIPTLKYFKGGKSIGTLVGVVSRERIEDLLKKGL